jgi:hypothetical protein
MESGDRTSERLGDIDIFFKQVDALPRTSNGKFRTGISEMHQTRRAQELNTSEKWEIIQVS